MTNLFNYRRNRIECLDWFCGAGGFTAGAKRAGARFIHAANHAELPVETYAANHPEVEDVRMADLLEIDPAHAPAADVAFMSPSCVAHSRARATREYEQGPNEPTLFDARPQRASGGSVAKQERTRQTMIAPLRYAAAHRPPYVVCENVVETCHWGYARKGKPGMGDGAHYRWWRAEWEKLGYEVSELFLNSAAFGVAQSRDRWFFVARRADIPAPDLDFRPPAWCPDCETIVESVQAWKPRKKTWPLARWGKLGQQYVYRCPTCATEADLLTPPAYAFIDWTNRGTRIGDKDWNPKTLDRMRRGLDLFRSLPPYHDPVTGQVVDGFSYTHSGNTYEHKGQTRARSLWRPRATVTSDNTEGLVMLPPAAMTKYNGSAVNSTPWHHTGRPIGTVTSKDTTMLMMSPHVPSWLRGEPFERNDVAIEDCTARMMDPWTELVGFMGFPTDYVWPTTAAGHVTRLLGQAVTPPLVDQLAERIYATLR